MIEEVMLLPRVLAVIILIDLHYICALNNKACYRVDWFLARCFLLLLVPYYLSLPFDLPYLPCLFLVSHSRTLLAR